MNTGNPYNPGVPQGQPNDVSMFSSFNPITMTWYGMQWDSLGGTKTGLIRGAKRSATGDVYAYGSNRSNKLLLGKKYESAADFHSPGIFGTRGLFNPIENVSNMSPWKWARSSVAGMTKGGKEGSIANAVNRSMNAGLFSNKAKTLNRLLSGSGGPMRVTGMTATGLKFSQNTFTAGLWLSLAFGTVKGAASLAVYGSGIVDDAIGRIRGSMGTRFSTNVDEHFFTAQSSTERVRAQRVIQEAHGGSFRPSIGGEASNVHRTHGSY